jgi:hypothetical protein
MKKLLIILGVVLMATNLHCQMWGPATPFQDANGPITSMYEFNNDLIVSGNFTSIGGIVAHYIANWNGNNWSTLGVGNTLQTPVKDMIKYNGALYFTSDKLYKWDGNSIQEVTYYSQTQQSNVSILGGELHVFNNSLYIVSFDGNNGNGGIIVFDGSNFSEIMNSSGIIQCIEDYNGSIYIGTSDGLYKLQNGSWINMNGVTTGTPLIMEIESFNGELYALGNFQTIGGISIRNFAKFDGANWSNPNLPQGYFPVTTQWISGVNHLSKINNELYLAGTFSTVISNATFIISPLTKFNGTNWVQLAYNTSEFGACSIIYNNELFCGGQFSYLFPTNGIPVAHLVKLDPNLTNLKEKNTIEFSIFPNPTSNSITIKGENNMNQSFQISDQMGREVFKGKLTGTETEVNLSSLSKGIYTLKIDGNYQPAQIVKE